MSKERILIIEASNYSQRALKIYSEIGAVYCCNNTPSDWQKKDEISIIVCRLNYFLDSRLLSKFPNVRILVSPTTGLNHIDQTYCEENKIKIISLKGETNFLDTIHSTSELAFSLILALVRNIVPGIHSVVSANEWNRDLYCGREFSALTLGLLGFGRIGQHMVKYAKAFGMSVFACDPFVDRDIFLKSEVIQCKKEELLSKTDIISIHVDYRIENKNMLDRDDFIQMGKGKYLVNTSRGELISENDLIWALEKGHLAGAALDVLAGEQSTHDFFNKAIIKYAKKNRHLIITPHIGGCTKEAMSNTEIFIAEKTKQFFVKKDYAE